MKVISILALSLFLFQTNPAISQNVDFKKLVEQKRYTELQALLKIEKIDKKTKNFYQSILLNVFNQPAKSNELIAKALKKSHNFSDWGRFVLLTSQNDNYVKLFDYARAYETKRFLLDNYASFYEKKQLEDEIQTLNLLEALKKELPQTISNVDNESIALKKNLIGLQTVPVSISGYTLPFIFDTGAGISTITDSMAALLKLRILDKVPISVEGGITGLGTNIRLGIADKVDLGKTVLRNVVFLVFPDSALTINLPTGRYMLEPILGFPVIKELGSITFYDDRLEISAVYSGKSHTPNMAIDFLKPILFLQYRGEDLPFTFDTGADRSVLSEVFYNRHKSSVELDGRLKTSAYGGAGGIKTFKVYEMPAIQFINFGDTVTLKNVDVSTERISAANDVYYGNLGQDVIKQFNSMTINFREAWIKFNK